MLSSITATAAVTSATGWFTDTSMSTPVLVVVGLGVLFALTRYVIRKLPG